MLISNMQSSGIATVFKSLLHMEKKRFKWDFLLLTAEMSMHFSFIYTLILFHIFPHIFLIKQQIVFINILVLLKICASKIFLHLSFKKVFSLLLTVTISIDYDILLYIFE